MSKNDKLNSMTFGFYRNESQMLAHTFVKTHFFTTTINTLRVSIKNVASRINTDRRIVLRHFKTQTFQSYVCPFPKQSCTSINHNI